MPFETSECDAWGQPFVFRCPGLVHRTGWDLYSVGPDGIDERGGGDDLLVGEDGALIAGQ
ncbi:MAG: type II secretion system protein GspG [Planctomycetota bacterium]